MTLRQRDYASSSVCLCCGSPPTRKMLGIYPACAACAEGTCERCQDDEEDQ